MKKDRNLTEKVWVLLSQTNQLKLLLQEGKNS